MSDPSQFVPTPPQPAPSGLSDNAAGALAYVTIIPAIIFLVVPPYNQKPIVRFHSWQSIFLCIAWIVIDVGLHFVGRIPVIGWLVFFLGPLVGLAFFILWLIVMIKAFNGQLFKIPVIGDFAQKQANG